MFFVYFSCLIPLARSSTMLNESDWNFALLLVLRTMIQSFTVKHDASCGILVAVLCQAEEVSSYSEFAHAAQHSAEYPKRGPL